MKNKRPFIILKAHLFLCLTLGLSFCRPAEYVALDDEMAILRSHITILAADNFSGRLAGSPGCQKAEEYLRQCFRQHRLCLLKGLTDYSWPFQLKSLGFDRQTSFFKLKGEGSEEIEFQYGLDFIPLRLGSVGEVEAELVFAGYGIRKSMYGYDYDDYSGLDVKDKIVLVLRGEPRFFPPENDYLPVYRSFYQLHKKIELAASLKAKAIIFITPPHLIAQGQEALFEDPIYYLYDYKPKASSDLAFGPIPAVFVTGKLAKTLCNSLPFNLESIEQALENRQKPATLKTTSLRVSLACQITSTPSLLECRNIVGVLPAMNPAIPGRYILICAHHDHLGQGIGTGDTIFNGADDNASGVATLLYLMQALSGQRLRHNLIFITFSAEEFGLFGSQAFAFKSDLDLKQIRYVINLDMLGRNPQKELSALVKFNKPSHQLSRILVYLNQAGVLVTKEEPTYSDKVSDDYWFAQLGIETFFFNSGLHPDYHTVDDEADRIAYNELAKRARLIKDFLLFLDSY